MFSLDPPWRLLIVEDEPAIQRVFQRLLRRETSLEVVVAASGTEALAADGPFDLLITDVVMPGMAGPALAGQLQRRWPGLPVLYVSGYSEDDAELPFAAPLLQKPFSRGELLAAIRRSLDATGADDDDDIDRSGERQLPTLTPRRRASGDGRR